MAGIDPAMVGSSANPLLPMEIQIAPFLKTLATIAANAGRIASELKAKNPNANTFEEREKLAREASETGEHLADTTARPEALAQQMKMQAELNERHERRARVATLLAVIATAIAVGSAGIALFLI